MAQLFFAVIFLGMVQPGGKLFIDSGLGLLPFCFVFLLVRVIAQLPVAFFKSELRISSFQHLFYLALFGVVGASLHFLEFKGLSQRLPVGTATFLLYSYPLAIIYIDKYLNSTKIELQQIAAALVALFGMGLISLASLKAFDLQFVELVPALLSSLAMAIWISYSRFLRKRNYSSLNMSIYFDLFSLMGISAIALASGEFVADQKILIDWLANFQHVALIVVYGIFIGALPNLLFYSASKKINTMTSSLALLFEPIIATLLGLLIWQNAITPVFFVGAFFVLAANALGFINFNFNKVRRI